MFLIQRYICKLGICTMVFFAPLCEAQQGSIAPFVALQSDLVVIQTTIDVDGTPVTNQQTSHYYRNASGSTRLEEPGQIVIVNKTLNKMYILIPATNIAIAIDLLAPQSANTQPQGALLAPQQPIGVVPVQNLGVQTISGVLSSGQRTIITGNGDPSTSMSIDRWSSLDLLLDVQTIVSSTSGSTSSTYINIVTGGPEADSLFVLPDTYQLQ